MCYDRTDVPHKRRLGFVTQKRRRHRQRPPQRSEADDLGLFEAHRRAVGRLQEASEGGSPAEAQVSGGAAHSASDHSSIDRDDLAAQRLGDAVKLAQAVAVLVKNLRSL